MRSEDPCLMESAGVMEGNSWEWPLKGCVTPLTGENQHSHKLCALMKANISCS